MGSLHSRGKNFSNLAEGLSVAIFVYLMVSAAANPVSSALCMVSVNPTPPEFT